jgi:FKBP-type peptidyl-prolyl cis-trans isomerase
MISKFEIIGIGISVLCMAVALYLIRVETTLLTLGDGGTQTAEVSGSNVVFVADSENENGERVKALVAAADISGNLKKMVIDDIVLGTGEEVTSGDTVVVHYVGTLQDGTEFDNSNKRGEPFEFTVGEGRVIKGWEEGLVGMKVGGQRILVIPPDMGYGKNGIGPIPGNATLVFSINLLEIK